MTYQKQASFLARLTIVFLLSTPLPGLAQRSAPMRVIDSILGAGIGKNVESVSKKLDRLTNDKRKESGEENEEGEEREGGRKEAWTLTSNRYATIALKADERGRIVWVTGFVRPGKEIPFSELGDLSSATTSTDAIAIWNVATPAGGYRLVAKGQDGRARVVSLLSLAAQQTR
jgi:hypothetical protein